MPKKPATRQLILEAAVACIEEFGLANVTTRKIAIAAGTNVAAINYHFRSKDDLIAETLSMTINHMLEDVFAALEVKQTPFKERLAAVLFYLLDGSLRFPGISRAHLGRAIADASREGVSARTMDRLFDRLCDRACQAYPRKRPEDLRLRLSQVLASAMFTMLSPRFFAVARGHTLIGTKRAHELAASYAGLFVAGI